MGNSPHCPPPNFFPAGVVRRANLIKTPQLIAARPHKAKGAKARGLNYEAKVQDYLLGIFPDTYLPGPWFEFTSAENPRPRWCQADGLNIDPRTGEILLVEIKLKHTPVAWWQMFHLYAPVIQRIFDPSRWVIKTVEVCKWFDPAIRTPERPKLRGDLASVERDEFAVHIWG